MIRLRRPGGRLRGVNIRLVVAGVLCVVGLGLAAAADHRPQVEIGRVAAPPRLEDFLTMEPVGEVARSMVMIGGMIQQKPEEGAPSTQRTETYLGYDDTHLYAIFVCFDDRPEKVRANYGRRETGFGDDIVEIMLDTFNDERRAYAFITNPFGVQSDAIWTEGDGFDFSFDTVWDSLGRLTDQGYVVRFAIPFSSLRFPAAEKQRWGFLLVRDINRLNEDTFWPEVSLQIDGRLNQAAILEGLEGISPGRNTQLIPYLSGRSFKTLEEDTGNGQPGFTRDSAEGDLGLDAKFVFQDALVLDATINPDFSQVESDEPQVTVNRRFEVFFPEKRPFFLENAGFFRTPINLLFTRRIADPDGGLRLTGKIGKWAIGGLAINDRAPGETAEPGDPLVGEKARVGVLRLNRDLFGQSSLGMIYTDRDLGDGYNRVYGVDGRFKLNDNWVATLQAVGSETRDQDGTRRSGPAYRARINRNDRELRLSLELEEIDPDFQTDLGFVNRVGIRNLRQRTSYRFWPEGRRLISWGPSVSARLTDDPTGLRLDWRVNPEISFELRRQTRFGVWYDDGEERLRPEDFDGLTTTVDFDVGSFGGWIDSRFSDAFNFELSASSGDSVSVVSPLPEPASRSGANVELIVRPGRRVRIQQDFLHTRLARQDGSWLFTNQIHRTRLSYQLTRLINLRAILQYNRTDADPLLTTLERKTRNLTGDLLLSYIVNPWTAAYIGYTGNYRNLELIDDPTGRRLVRTDDLLDSGRQLFVKISYLFKP